MVVFFEGILHSKEVLEKEHRLLEHIKDELFVVLKLITNTRDSIDSHGNQTGLIRIHEDELPSRKSQHISRQELGGFKNSQTSIIAHSFS
jgi:hypothetical protein